MLVVPDKKLRRELKGSFIRRFLIKSCAPVGATCPQQFPQCYRQNRPLPEFVNKRLKEIQSYSKTQNLKANLIGAQPPSEKPSF